jgi:hypothetical protein
MIDCSLCSQGRGTHGRTDAHVPRPSPPQADGRPNGVVVRRAAMRLNFSFLTACLLVVMVPGEALAKAKTLDQGAVHKRLAFSKAEAFGTVHVQAVINAPSSRVWNLFANLNGWRGWMPLVMEAYFFSDGAARAIPKVVTKDRALFDRLRQQHPGKASVPAGKGRSSRVSFEAFDLPWPIKNEWVVNRYTFDASKANTGRYRVTWHKVWFTQQGGYWTLEPFRNDPKRTLLTYHFNVRAKRGLTLVLFKMGVKRTINRMIKAMRKRTA